MQVFDPKQQAELKTPEGKPHPNAEFVQDEIDRMARNRTGFPRIVRQAREPAPGA
jgi:hypothetical protein